MDQQRRVISPLAASSSSSSSPLLGITDDFYELLHQSTATRTRLYTDPIIPALKMEPELAVTDFTGAAYSWGTQFGTVPHLYPDTNTLPSLTNYTTTPPPVDIATYTTGYTTRDTTPATAQMQALRDFMVLGAASSPVPGFYNEEAPSLAYRALCSEIYATTERSPHRSQFQRENHILAERQRREEMNEKFSALRAMIPKATKKDKASIVGDTIDYVLELEKRLKQLQACKDVHCKGESGVKKRKSLCEDGIVESTKGNGGSTSSETTTTMNACAAVLPVAIVGECSVVSSPSDQVTAESLLSGKMKEAAAEVDVQQLGNQAVVKVVCNRRPGHVLRVLNALEECKVEVLQSNVMTVADNSIHFVTVQLEEGVSVPTEELVSAVLQAINPPEG